jgi:hypothetical protein
MGVLRTNLRFVSGGFAVGRRGGGGGLAPPRQANPWEATTPGVYVYGLPRGTDYFEVSMVGGGAAGREAGTGLAPPGKGGSGAGGCTAKYSGIFVSTSTVWGVHVGAGGTTLDGGSSKLVYSGGYIQVASGGVGDGTPGTGYVTESVAVSAISAETGAAGGAVSGTKGGGGGEAGGGIFASAGGVGGATGTVGLPGAFGGGGGGGGGGGNITPKAGGHGGDGAVRITAYRADGGLV